MERYLNASLSAEERADDLLSKMSLEEKMGQINCLFPWNGSEEQDEKDCPHGIGQVSTLSLRSCQDLEEAAAWQRRYQTMIMEKSEHHIPATFHMEGLCGAYLPGAMSFPSGIGRASSFDTALEEKVGDVVRRQETACGITQILAPVLDISRDSRMGRQGESYGEDPALAAAMGSAYVRGVQQGETAGRHAESEAKHFLAFHYSTGGIHGASVESGERQLKEVYAKPFQAAITQSDLRGIMPCYCSINGEPVSSSEKFLTKWLREDMGFDGVAGADYSAVSNVHNAQHVTESNADAGQMCLAAGLDIEQQNCICYNDELTERFRSGEADIEILNRAVRRILRAKFRMGLFEHPFALSGGELQAAFASTEEDRGISLQSARESLVLIKNNGALPIQKNVRKIAVIGPHMDNARIFFGGYTHLSMVEAEHADANSIAGIKAGTLDHYETPRVPGTQIQSDAAEEFDAILKWQKPDCRSLLQQLREDLPKVEFVYAPGYAVAGDDLSRIPEALEACKGVDLILMQLGGRHTSCSVASMGEGVDATDINLPICQDTFIREAVKLGIPLVGIHFNGRPISSDTADQCLDAILEAWNPSEMGAQALSEVLRGVYNPSGKMPVTTARSAGQIPIYYNHSYGSAWHQGESIGFPDYVDMSHKPRYCFGHGLSYTTFAYDNLTIDKKSVKPDESIAIELDVTNTGDCEGTEIVQLYVQDEYASCSRPVQELAGFARAELQPGETGHVRFNMKVSQLAFLDRGMKWKTEKGTIRVYAGSSSQDIRLEGRFAIAEDGYVDERTRGFFAESNVSAALLQPTYMEEV